MIHEWCNPTISHGPKKGPLLESMLEHFQPEHAGKTTVFTPCHAACKIRTDPPLIMTVHYGIYFELQYIPPLSGCQISKQPCNGCAASTSTPNARLIDRNILDSIICALQPHMTKLRQQLSRGSHIKLNLFHSCRLALQNKTGHFQRSIRYSPKHLAFGTWNAENGHKPDDLKRCALGTGRIYSHPEK